MKIRLEKLTPQGTLDPDINCSFEVTESSYEKLPVLPITDFSERMPHLTMFNEIFRNHTYLKNSRHKAIAMLCRKRVSPVNSETWYNFNGLYFVYLSDISKWIAFEYKDNCEDSDSYCSTVEVSEPWHGPIYRVNNAALAVIRRYYN